MAKPAQWTCYACDRVGKGFRVLEKRFYCPTCYPAAKVEYAIEPWLEPDADFLGNNTVVIDFMTDLFHYCDKHGVDFDGCLTAARGHYEDEIEKPEPAEKTTDG